MTLEKMRKARALGQNVFPPSTSPASHRSHRSSEAHLRHLQRTSFMTAPRIALLRASPWVPMPGSRPTRRIMDVSRLAEPAARKRRNHTTAAAVTVTMRRATVISNPVRLVGQFSKSNSRLAQKPVASPSELIQQQSATRRADGWCVSSMYPDSQENQSGVSQLDYGPSRRLVGCATS